MNFGYTSQQKVNDLRRPERPTEMKVFVEKSCGFVDTLWASYVARNSTDLQYVVTKWKCNNYRPLIEDDKEEADELNMMEGMWVAELDEEKEEKEEWLMMKWKKNLTERLI